MAYEDPYNTDPYGSWEDPEEARKRQEALANNQNTGVAGGGSMAAGGFMGGQPGQPAPAPKTGYDLEAFRKAWAYGGSGFGTTTSMSDLQKFLQDRQDITSGVTLKNEKAYDPQGRYIADLIGDVGGKNSRIFLDGVGSNGKPRTPPKTPPGGGINPPGGKISPPGITPPGPPNLPPGGGGGNPPGVPPVPPPPTPPTRDPRIDELYNTLLARSKQGLAVNRDDPAVRGQADAYAANEERARRNYLSDVAEQSGPNANLRGEQRMGAERAGQRTGAFEAELMGREIQAKRDEIATALTSMQGLLTFEQDQSLRKELALLDDATKRLSINNQNSQFYAGLKQQDKQFAQDMKYKYASLSQQQKQFMLDLGLRWNGQEWERDPANPKNRL